MRGYFLAEEKLGELIPRGVFTDQNLARYAPSSGRFLVIPIEADRLYDNLLDDTLPGAVYVDAVTDDLANRIETLRTQALNQLGNIQNEITDIKARLDALEGVP